MIRILLVDDQTILCEMMQTWLEREPDFEVVGSANNGEKAIALVESLQPDIVLIDIQMPGMDGVTATQIICQHFPQTKAIVLSGHDNDVYLTNALRAGAKGYLLKNTAAGELAATIRSVDKGYSQVGPGLLEKIAAKMSAPDASGEVAPASQWEEGELSEAEFRLLLEDFDPQALSDAVGRLIAKDEGGKAFAHLTEYLKQQPTNLSALYLAGVLAHRVQKNSVLAFQYLRFGFKEGLRQNLPGESLLLFYREGALLQPEEAFYWLTGALGNFNSDRGISFLLQEAAQMGIESTPYKIVLAWGKIRAMQKLTGSLTQLGSRLENLQQGFARLSKTAQII
jgi:DNA-binding NarL/FixJ family response regulator